MLVGHIFHLYVSSMVFKHLNGSSRLDLNTCMRISAHHVLLPESVLLAYTTYHGIIDLLELNISYSYNEFEIFGHVVRE